MPSEIHRLTWLQALAIWWAQTWRAWSASVAISLIIALAVVIVGRGTAKQTADTLQSGIGFFLQVGIFFMWMAVQVWALRESLVDRYRSFKLDVQARPPE